VLARRHDRKMISDYLLSPDPTAVLVGLHMIQHVTPQELWEELLEFEQSFIDKPSVRTRQFSIVTHSYSAIRVFKELGIGKVKRYPYDVELGECLCIVLDEDIDMFIYTCYWNRDGWDHLDTTSLLYKHLDEVTDDDKLLIYNKLLEYIHHDQG
jgi:hypothetical protein